MASCNSCGAEVSPGGRFCKHCGSPTSSAETGQPGPEVAAEGTISAATARVSTSSNAWPTNYSSNSPSANSSAQPKARPLWRNPVSLAVVGVVIIAIVGAVLVLSRSSSSAQSTASAAVGDLQTGNWSKLCSLAEPSQQANCDEAIRSPSASVSFPKVALASVVVSTNGNQATATISCAGASYCSRFTGANSSAQLVKVNGTWYIVGDFSSSAGSGSSGNSGSGTTPTTQNTGNEPGTPGTRVTLGTRRTRITLGTRGTRGTLEAVPRRRLRTLGTRATLDKPASGVSV